MTVGELGMRLVVGTGPIDGSGVRNTSLEFLDWTAKDERQLAAFRKKHKRMAEADMVSHVLARFCARWGDHDFTKMSPEAKELVISQAPSADVFHAWCMLRIENMGEDYELKFECESCSNAIDYILNVEEIEVNVPRDAQVSLIRPYTLKKGIQYHTKKYKDVKVGLFRWRTHRSLGATPGLDLIEVKLATIEGTVCGIVGVNDEIVLPPTSVDTLQKIDYEALYDFIDEDAPGPDLSFKLDCPHCQVTLMRPMLWRYDLFFSA
jgi:hypothetical protein